MVICPVALAVGCRRCPIVTVCPVKATLGDFRETLKDPPKGEEKSAPPGQTAKGQKR
jgi:hypothetical protein